MAKKKWYRLDNAAVAFPAINTKKYTPQYRISANLIEPIDPVILNQAIGDLRRRFPTFFVTLRKGTFWFYLEEMKKPLLCQPDFACPLTLKSRFDLKKSCVKVLYFENRIAVEIFHSVTDGHGGSIFFKNLLARYIELKYSVEFKKENDIYDLTRRPSREEIEDAFTKVGGKSSYVQPYHKVYKYTGTKEPRGFSNLIVGIIDTDKALEVAKSFNVSLTSFLSAVLTESYKEIQEERVKFSKQRYVGVTIPYDLRRIIPSNTFRNYALKTYISIDPKLVPYSFEYLCNELQRQLKSETTVQKVTGAVYENLRLQNIGFIKFTPLFFKNIVINSVFEATGELGGCTTMSNLGLIPNNEGWNEYIDRFDFLLSTGNLYPNNIGVISYNGKTNISFVRRIKETYIEQKFFSKLVEFGIPVEIESSQRGE